MDAVDEGDRGVPHIRESGLIMCPSVSKIDTPFFSYCSSVGTELGPKLGTLITVYLANST